MKPLRLRRLLLLAASAPGLARAQTPPATAPTRAEERRPWRAHEALGVRWLRFGLEQRTRFEHLQNDVRVANPGDATGLFLRTLLHVDLRFAPVAIFVEVADARAWTTEATPLNTTLVNPLEVLQGWVGLRGDGVLARGDSALVALGRMTIDLGSRRVVARNEFRNTINAFTGLDLQWTSPARDLLRVFVGMPITRLPATSAALRSNDIEFDRENTDALFWAVFFASRPLPARFVVEGYVLGLHEGDGALAPSSNRQLITPGVRVLRPPAAGEVDLQLEVIGQFGRSRATTAATDTADLDHIAFALHAACGYRFNVGWAPRVVVQYDHASGDASPDDGVNQRFDPLFGARRFDFGPTSLWGVIARSNLISPGLRVEAQPHRTVDAFVSYRPIWLAAARDAWVTAPLRDPTGASGDFVGQQVEGRVRWHVLPGNLSLDLGGAAFVRGEFAQRAPRGEAAPSLYVYSQLTGTL
ncbi:MAG: alginate export family protein [Polyangiales bacterium]